MYSPIYSFQNVQDEFWFAVFDALHAAKTNHDIDMIVDAEWKKLNAKYKLRPHDNRHLLLEVESARAKMKVYR